MSDVKNKRVHIYIDHGAAENALVSLNGTADRLNKTIEKGRLAGKSMTAEIAKLEQVKANIKGVQEQIDKGLRPSMAQTQTQVIKLKNELRRMSEDAPGYAEKFKAFKHASAELNRMQTAVNGVNAAQNDMIKGSSLLTKAGVGIGAFFGTLAANVVSGISSRIQSFFSDSVAEAEEAEESISRLHNTLENLERAEVFDRLSDSADAMAEKFTYLDNDAILEVFQQMITYGKLTEKEISDLLPVIIDFAAKHNISINEAASGMIKFLEGNSRALKDYGVNAKDGANVSERLGIIFSQLAPKVRDAGEAFMETSRGIKASTQQDIADIQEDLGTKLQPAVKNFYSIIQQVLTGISNAWNMAGRAIRSLSEEGRKQNELLDKQAANENIRKNAAKIVGEISGLSVDEQINEQNRLIATLNQQASAYKQLKKEGKDVTVMYNNMYSTQAKLDALTNQINVANDKRKLGLGDNTPDKPSKAPKAAKEVKSTLDEYNAFAKKLNESINDLLTPEASKKFIALLRQTEEDLERLKKLAATDQQYNEGKLLILKKQEEAIKALILAEEKLYTAPLNDSTGGALPRGFEASAPLEKKVRVEILPEIAPEDEAVVGAALGKALNRLINDQKSGFKLDVLNAGNPGERQRALLAELEYEHFLELQNKDLTDNDKLVKEAEYQEARKQINFAAQKEIVEYFQMGLQLAGEAINIISSFQDVKSNRENAALQRELKQNEVRKNSIRDLENSKVINASEARRRINAIEREEDKKKEELEKKQFERNKKVQIAQALINGALAATNIWATVPKADFGVTTFILLGLSALATLASVATIASKKYGKGGKLTGPSHSNGGMPVINPVTGQKEAEVEGGEYILSKATVNNNRRIADMLLDTSLNRNGARIQHFWENRPYRTINYGGVKESMQKVKYATGGIYLGNNPENSSAPQMSTDPALLNTLRQMQQVNATLAQTIQNLQDNGVEANLSLNKIEKAQNTRQRILDDAIMR